MNRFLSSIAVALDRPDAVVLGRIAGSSGNRLHAAFHFVLVDLGGVEFVQFVTHRQNSQPPQQGIVAIRRAHRGEPLQLAWKCRYAGYPLVLCTELDISLPSSRPLIIPTSRQPGMFMRLGDLLRVPAEESTTEHQRIETLLDRVTSKAAPGSHMRRQAH